MSATILRHLVEVIIRDVEFVLDLRVVNTQPLPGTRLLRCCLVSLPAPLEGMLRTLLHIFIDSIFELQLGEVAKRRPWTPDNALSPGPGLQRLVDRRDEVD